MRVLTSALLIGGLLVSGGCGGGDDSDATGPSASTSSTPPAVTRSADAPTSVDLAKVIIAAQDGSASGTYTLPEATCVGKILVESKLTDASLKLFESTYPDFVLPAEQQEVYGNLVPLIATCLTGRLPAEGPSS